MENRTRIRGSPVQSHKKDPVQDKTMFCRILDFVSSNSDSGFWIPYFGFWISYSGFRILDSGSIISGPGFRILDFRIWILDPGFRVLDFEYWISYPGLWILIPGSRTYFELIFTDNDRLNCV